MGPLDSVLNRALRKVEFPMFGWVDTSPLLDDPKSSFYRHVEEYETHLAQGHHGAMGYLARGSDRETNPRINPKLLFPELKSVISVGWPYSTRPMYFKGISSAKVGRYARGLDYHELIRKKLELAMDDVRAHVPHLKYKICVDSSAVLERTWAYLCGLGWIGKNKMLLNRKYGSYFLVAEVFTNLETRSKPRVQKNLCGECRLCLKGCPTSVFDNGEFDSRKCISYWTLEKRGSLRGRGSRSNFEGWIGGCDICQEVCPFNAKRTSREASQEISQDVSWKEWSPLLRAGRLEYQTFVKNSALNRMKPGQHARNIAIAFRNWMSENSQSIEVSKPDILNGIRTQLSEWAKYRDRSSRAAWLEWKRNEAYLLKRTP